MSGIIKQNTNRYSGLIKAPAGGGAWNFISKQTASASATLDFTSGLDSTYSEYMFYISNIHPATDDVLFSFQVNASGESDYNETITSARHILYITEAAGSAAIGSSTETDQAQGTSFQTIAEGVGSDNDQAVSGWLALSNPSSTTFVTNFWGQIITPRWNDAVNDEYVGGYVNTTGAITNVQFKFSSGNIDAGSIFLHGLSTT
tara:strand:+ start:579 stop:1187 length:609 start_codon:yes stop_codon:yes gene_type:complete